jgi:hypothetical protein
MIQVGLTTSDAAQHTCFSPTGLMMMQGMLLQNFELEGGCIYDD